MRSSMLPAPWLLLLPSLLACEPTSATRDAPGATASSSPVGARSAQTPAPSAEQRLARRSQTAAATSSATGPSAATRCPEEMVRVDEFCIDRYEAHLTLRGRHGRGLRHSPYQRPEKGVTYLARSAAHVVPQAYINRHEASSACRSSGKRLCTLAEWYAACSGPKRLTYPYGNQQQAGYCNSGKDHLLAKLFGKDPRRWSYKKHFNDPDLNREPGFLAKTGSYPRCVSAHGAYDLVGNLHEWISDRVDYSLPQKILLRNDIHAKLTDNLGKAIFMGGFCSTTDEHGPGCRFVTIGHGPRYHDYTTGFRCCADVEGDDEAQ